MNWKDKGERDLYLYEKDELIKEVKNIGETTKEIFIILEKPKRI